MTKTSLVIAVAVGLLVQGVAFFNAAPTASAATTPSPSDTNYVKALYRDVLGRGAGSAEVAAWAGDLSSGSKTRTAVVEGFVLSPESLELIVRADFAAIVLRAPSSAEILEFSDFLRSWDAESELQIKLLGSTESFVAISNEAWIDKAYRVLAGRTPTAEEVSNRRSQLAGGQTHNWVARNIAAQPAARLWRFDLIYRTLVGRSSTSVERRVYSGAAVFKDLWYRRLVLAGDEYYRAANRPLYECLIRSLYRDLLGRVPSADEVKGWVDDLVLGRASQADVARQFVHSEEYVNAIIASVYQQVQGRAPSGVELSFYRTRLTDRFRDDHWSRNALVIQALSSPEFLSKYQGREWVQQAYHLVLGRWPGENEVDGWMGSLETMGYAWVADRIAVSDESLRRIIGGEFERLLGIPAGQDPQAYEPWRALMAAAPQDLGQNAEFIAYAKEVGGQALVGALTTVVLNALGLGFIAEALKYLGIPDISEKAERLYALAHHPMHDMDLTIRILSGPAYLAHLPSDTTPPTTTATLAGTAGLNGWYRSDVIVKLRAADAPGLCCSGVRTSEYRIGAGAWKGYLAPIVVTQEGRTAIQFRSTDSAGNVEATKTLWMKIDRTRPVLQVTSPTATQYPHTASLTLSFGATDATSGVRRICATLDGSAVTTGTVIDVLTLPLGAHSFRLRAVDRAGNAGGSTVRFTVIATEQSVLAAIKRLSVQGKIDPGIARSLISQWRGIVSASSPDDPSVSARVDALLTHIRAQSGKHISLAAATLLITDIEWVASHWSR